MNTTQTNTILPLQIGVGAKIELHITNGRCTRITSSKYGTDWRSNDLKEDGTLGRTHGYARHHRAMDALAEAINAEGLDAALKMYAKQGVCCICGAQLTDQESVARGIGPECIKKPHGKYVMQRLRTA